MSKYDKNENLLGFLAKNVGKLSDEERKHQAKHAREVQESLKKKHKAGVEVASSRYFNDDNYQDCKSELVNRRHHGHINQEEQAQRFAALQRQKGIDPDKPVQKPLIPYDQIQNRAAAHEAKPRNKKNASNMIKEIRARNRTSDRIHEACNQFKPRDKYEIGRKAIWYEIRDRMAYGDDEGAARAFSQLDALRRQEEAEKAQ